jgi:cation transport ATPase
MKRFFSKENLLEAVAALFTLGAILGVLQTFIIGKHFVIPTMILVPAILFGNLARFGMNGQRWAKHTLFWMFFLMACHAFFALFWAATPREILGEMFLPVYGLVFAILASSCWIYAKENKLFG